MGRTSQVKTEGQHKMDRPFKNDFSAKVRLNVNDLLKKRKEESKVDKRVNVLILSGASFVTVIILLILSL